MSQRRRFSLGTVSAGASVFLVMVLMLWSPVHSLCLLIGITYAVSGRSAWGKTPKVAWRSGVLISWIAFLITVVALYGQLTFSAQEGGMIDGLGFADPLASGTRLVLSVILAGAVLLPLALASSVHTFRTRRQTLQG